MFKNFAKIHYKERFLYGLYITFLTLTSIAAVVDFSISNYKDAVIDALSVLIVGYMFWYYTKYRNYNLASSFLFVFTSFIIFIFVFTNGFDIGVIFTLLVPMVAFILLPTKKVITHVGIYFATLILIFAYGYITYESHPLLHNPKYMSAYIIAAGFVLAFGIFYHITIEKFYLELESANRQKTLLLQEIHHRVKNNLNIISAILGLQKFDSNIAEVHNLVDQNRLRLESMALIHEAIYKCEEIDNIEFKRYIKRVIEHILKAKNGYNNRVDIKLDIEPIKLGFETIIQLGMIINELVTNSIKYAFSDTKSTISLSLVESQGEFLLSYSDNGSDQIDLVAGFGSMLIQMCAEQINATVDIDFSSGLKYELRFKSLK